MPVTRLTRAAFVALVAIGVCHSGSSRAVFAQAAATPPSSLPRLHHVELNSVDPERAIEWYLKLWPSAKRTTVAGLPAVESDMFLVFNKVDTPAPGAWRNDLHRGDPQSAFWHIGANTNSTVVRGRLDPLGIASLPLWVSPNDTTTVWRSGLAPDVGTLTAKQLDTAANARPRDGGFSYIVAPDGVLFELTGGPETKDSFSHIHFFHEQPLCAANWYVEHLGMELPPVRDANGVETPRPLWSPCESKYGEAGWPALEPAGTIRQPAGNVRFGNGAMAWYPRQCVGDRCGRDQKLVPSRGQVLDHIAFTVVDFDRLYATLKRDGVRILEQPHPFDNTRAFMIEDPDGLAIELIDRRP